MLVSGFYGLHAAAKDLKKQEAELKSMQENVDAYHVVLAELGGTENYDSLTREMEALQEEQDEDSAKHRKDLAVYTATRGGLEKGQSALYQAESALNTGRMQYESGVSALEAQAAAFEIIYAQAMEGKAQLESAKPLLEAAEEALDSLQKLLNNLHEVGDLLDLETEEADSGEDKEDVSEEENNPEKSSENGEQCITGVKEEDSSKDSDDNIAEEEIKDSDHEDEQTAVTNEEEQTDSKSETPSTQDSPKNDVLSEETQDSTDSKKQTDYPEQEGQNGQPDNTVEEPLLTEDTPGDTGGALSEETQQETEQQMEEVQSKTTVAEAVQSEVPVAEEEQEDESEVIQSYEESLGEPADNTSDIIVRSPETSGDAENMRDTILSAYDTLLEAYLDMVKLIRLLQDCEIPVELARQALEAAGLPTEDLPETGSIVLVSSEDIAALEETLGMSMEEYGVMLQNERETVASVEIINEDQFGTIRQAYTDNKETVWRFASNLEEKLPALREMIATAKAQISTAEAALKQVEAARATLQQSLQALSSAGAQIEQGAQALEEGKAQLNAQQNKLDEQAEKLEAEKRKLDGRDEDIRQIAADAEEQKKLEDREKSLRMSLMTREEIKESVLSGISLADASEQWLDLSAKQMSNTYSQRCWASVLLLLSAAFAFLALPICFRTQPSKSLFLLLTGLCFTAASLACVIFYRMGRGLSYSALASGAIAAIQLLISAVKPERN